MTFRDYVNANFPVLTNSDENVSMLIFIAKN
jgi:hypothetical protein